MKSALCPPSKTAAVAANGNAAPALRWQPLAIFPLHCELTSSDAEVLRLARLLFVKSLSASNDEISAKETSEIATSRWQIERDAANENWRVLHLETGNVCENASLGMVLAQIEYSIVHELFVQVNRKCSRELFGFHGALLRKNGFGLIVVGPSEAGKSTLTCALWQNGWQILSDDCCFVDAQNRAFPAARRVSLRHGSRALLGENLWKKIEQAPSSLQTREGQIFHPHEIDASQNAAREAIAINAILLLERRDDTEKFAAQTNTPENQKITARRCNAARAAISLLPFCTLLPRGDLDDEASANRVLDWGGALQKIAPLASHAPIYALQRAELSQMVGAVEQIRDEL